MAKIAYILLCHKDPDAVIRQAERLTAAGDVMAIHFDARSAPAQYDRISKALKHNRNVCFAKKRVKCGWGEWSLVKATLNTLDMAMESFPDATHFYMLSGDCMAIKTAEYTHRFLDENDADFIETFDFFESDWIKTGMKEERLVYRHFFNERKSKKLFYGAMGLQQKLGLTRTPPPDLDIRIGSQWWCLRRATVEKVQAFVRARRDVLRFFSTTWIPDETFFQTIVPHLVPMREIESRTLTFLMFTDYGMPVTFYNDHYDMLLGQDFLFARKISPDAQDLMRRLGQLYAASDVSFTISGEGPGLFRYLSGRGRHGRRFAPRFWETETTLGRDRELMVVVCKKWHVAKRLLERIRHSSNVPMVDYLFNEESTPLPDLGGIQSSLAKRMRHRRALVRMLFDYFETDRLIICIDPGNIELLEDFTADRCTTRILDVECSFSDDYLKGHAMRVGLAGPQTSAHTFDRLMPTIRNDMVFEKDRLRDAGFEHYSHLREQASPDANAQALAQFLSVSQAKASDIVHSQYLFFD
ncbi:MAG: DUF5928 domain-containing protein [Pseudomonadota bacterium]